MYEQILEAKFPFELLNKQRVKFSLEDSSNTEVHGRIYIPRKMLRNLKNVYPKEVELVITVKY